MRLNRPVLKMARVGAASRASKRHSSFLDPRLLHYARATRTYLVVAVVIGGLTALLVIAQAWLLANVVAGAFIHHKGLAELKVPVVLLLGAIIGRAALGWASELAAQRASASAKSDLRTALAQRIAALGPAAIDRERSGSLAVLATTGIDSLDDYFARYLPQLLLAVVVPVAVIIAVVGMDWISAIIIAVTVPLIPIFMALVGASTRQRTERQLRSLQRLAGHFLDVVAGLPTLKVFGRAKAQAVSIKEVTGERPCPPSRWLFSPP
jgi:ATP-binding cassette subfamily C protein CydCD